MNSNIDTDIAFQVLKFLKSSPHKFLIHQNYSYSPLSLSLKSSSKLSSKNDSNSSHTTHLDTSSSHNLSEISHFYTKTEEKTLIALTYIIEINNDLEEPFLVFAQPLEHLLSIHILLEKNSKVLRVSLERNNDKDENNNGHNNNYTTTNNTYLIIENQLHYLQQKETTVKILEQIDSHLLENFHFRKTIHSPFYTTLPLRNEEHLNRIVIISNHSNLLFVPHINLSQLPLLEQLFNYSSFKCPLCNTMKSSLYFEQILKYLHYAQSITPQSSHFLGSQIIAIYKEECLSYYTSKECNTVTILQVNTTLALQFHSNYIEDIIQNSMKKHDTYLPIFINSKHEFVEILNAKHFTEITGVPYTTKLNILEHLLLKDKHLKQSMFSSFTLTPSAQNILFLIQDINSKYIIYENVTQHAITQKFKPQAYHLLFSPQTITFEHTILLELNEFSEFLKKTIVKYSNFPKVNETSLFSHSLFSYTTTLDECIKVSKDVSCKGYVLHTIHSIILEISKLFHIISCTEKEVFELCIILENILEICSLQNISTSQLDISFFNDLNIFSKKNYLEASKHYDIGYCQLVNKSLLQIIQVYDYLQLHSSYFQTDNEELYQFLEQFSSPFDVNSELNKNISLSHKKDIISNSLVKIFYY